MSSARIQNEGTSVLFFTVTFSTESVDMSQIVDFVQSWGPYLVSDFILCLMHLAMQLRMQGPIVSLVRIKNNCQANAASKVVSCVDQVNGDQYKIPECSPSQLE